MKRGTLRLFPPILDPLRVGYHHCRLESLVTGKKVSLLDVRVVLYEFIVGQFILPYFAVTVTETPPGACGNGLKKVSFDCSTHV